MDILIVMCIGILFGRIIFIRKHKKTVEYISLTCTFILIFSMGVMLGSRENFFDELSKLGITSFLFFALPTLLSIILVYYLTNKYLKNHMQTTKKGEQQ